MFQTTNQGILGYIGNKNYVIAMTNHNGLASASLSNLASQQNNGRPGHWRKLIDMDVEHGPFIDE